MHSIAPCSWTVRGLVLGCAAALLLAIHGRVGDREDGGGPARDAPPSLSLGRYPALGGSDVDCRDLGYAVWVDGPDPYSLDADNDRVGCERYLSRPLPDSARLR